MRKTAIALVAMLLPIMAWAQAAPEDEKSRNHAVYLEVLGGSTLVGVNYDARFNSRTNWGWRAGVSFGYSDSNGFFLGSSNTRAWAVPLGVNYLIGSKHNKLELGIGASLGLYNMHYNKVWSEPVDEATFNDFLQNPDKYPDVVAGGQSEEGGGGTFLYSQRKSDNRFGYFMFGDIGYRHVASNGFFLRLGITPVWNFNDSHAVYAGFSDEFHNFGINVHTWALAGLSS